MSRPITAIPGPICSCWSCTLSTNEAIDGNHWLAMEGAKELKAHLQRAVKASPDLQIYDRALGRIERVIEDLAMLEHMDHRARMEDNWAPRRKIL